MSDTPTIDSLLEYAADLSAAAAQSKAASQLQHDIVHGDKYTDVQTESGTVPSLARQAEMVIEKTELFISTSYGVFGTKALLDTKLGADAGQTAQVTDDPTASQNGWYTKLGASGTGSWKYLKDQPATTTALSVVDLLASAAAQLTELSFLSTWMGEANNGGALLRRFGRSAGLSVDAAVTGALTYVTAMFPTNSADPSKLKGSTVQVVVTGRYTGDFGTRVKLRGNRTFRVMRAGVAVNTVGRLVGESYADGRFKRVIQYTVTAEDSQLGVILSVEGADAAASKSTLIIDRVAFGVVDASAALTPYSVANLERTKLFEDVNANAGLSWQWEPTVITSGWGFFANGAVSLPAGAIAPAIAGMKIPAGSTGAGSYFFNLMNLDAAQVKLIAGSTVRITAKFTATAAALDLLDFQYVAGLRVARGAAASAIVDAKLVSMSQEGNVITKVIDYVVDATDVQWAVSLQVHGSAVVATQDISVQVKSLVWAVQGSSSESKRPADVATAARFIELIKPTEDKIQEKIVTSGNVLGKATVTGSADGNGAVLVRENGVIVGFDIPAGKSGAGVYSRIMIPFDAATRAAIVGKKVRMVLEAEVSATFAVDKPLRKDRGVYVDGSIGNAGSLISETFSGTNYVRVVEYLVSEGAALFGPVISYISGAISTSANSFRLKSVRWQVQEINSASQSVQDFMLAQNIASLPKDAAQADSFSAAVSVTGTQLDTQTFTSFTPTVQAFTINKLSGVMRTVEQTVSISPPDTELVSNYAFMLVAAPNGGSVPGARLPHQYSSNRVVKRVSDDVELVEGLDYAVKPNTCYIYGLKSIANVPCTITYTGHLHRYDLIAVDMATGNLVVTKGTGRAIDPEEYKPVLPAGQVRLHEVYVYPSGVDVLQSWRYRDLRDQLNGPAYEDWLTYSRSKLPKTMAKLRRGQPIRLIGYGSSSVDMGSGALNPLVPNINRDLASFYDRIPVDTRSKYPLYDNTDPDFAWSSLSTHIKYGFVWQLIAAMRERWDASVEYRNWGVGGTDSSATIVNGVPNGAHPDRLNAMLADQGDLMVLAFANGIGGDYWYSSHRTIIEAFKAQGGEVIVLTSPRLNYFGGASVDDTTWRKSYDDSIRVALDTGSAYVPTNLIEGPGREGCTGLSHRNMTNANLYNHGGPTQLGNTGKLMAMLIP